MIGDGGNKLRTYRLFKSSFKCEAYVSMNMSKRYRRAIALFRSGTAPINLELMRYGSVKKTVEERTCISCNDKVESEIHVLTQCPLYDDIRKTLFHQLEVCSAEIIHMDDNEKLIFLMSNGEHVRKIAKALCEIIERRKFIPLI